MLEKIPSKEELETLLGPATYQLWERTCEAVDCLYEMDTAWNKGGKAWDYEYKYKRGGKTLCGLYAKKNTYGFLVILGQKERDAFEEKRLDFSEAVRECYDQCRTYHDGKWLMLEPKSLSELDDLIRLLLLKRRPNRRQKG